MKVVKKQTNSKLCYICGIENEFGLKAPFYEMEDGSVISIFKYKEIHQSYPERVHGGLITAMLDEIAGRAIWVTEPETWAVTTELNVKFRKVYKRICGELRHYKGANGRFEVYGNS